MATTDKGLVNARWHGYRGQFADGTAAIPGESIRPVPRDEAEASDHWEPLGGPVKQDKDAD